MKSQQELYQALEKVEGIIGDNRLFETLQNASRMVNVISIMQAESKRSNDIAFKRAVEDVISMYSSLLDEAIDDLQAIAYAVNTHVDFGLSEPEAGEVEGKQDIASRLLPAIQLTRAGDNVQDIVIDRSGDFAEIHYTTGTVIPVGIGCDSGIAMIIDVCKALM